MTSRANRYRAVLPAALAAALTGCATGPDYARPVVPTTPAFKEAPLQEGTVLRLRDNWWSVFEDGELDRLEEEATQANPTIAAAAAAFTKARAAIGEAQAPLAPSLGVSASSNEGRSLNAGTGRSVVADRSLATASASWTLDLFGQTGRTVQAAQATATATAADLAGARLAIQGQVAASYLQLRSLDQALMSLDATVRASTQALRIAQARASAGVAPATDVLQARAALDTTQATRAETQRQRGALEHALAILVARPPAEFAIAPRPGWSLVLPAVPTMLPSELLTRRPDIVAAERRVASASASVGAQIASRFPSVTLSADAGRQAGGVAALITAGAGFWSLGAAIVQSVFDGGASRSRVAQARADHEQAAANYRSVVLSAFQEVEDQLLAIRRLREQNSLLQGATADAARARTIATRQYEAGTIAYADVIVAQTQALSAERSLIGARSSLATATVELMQAIGGGWPGLAGDGSTNPLEAPSPYTVAASPPR